MKLTIEQVRHVAQLARLGLTDSEMDALTGELTKILDYIDQLAAVDVSSVSPTAQVGGLGNVTRADQVRPSIGAAAALANAPSTEGGYFKVRAMQE